MFRFNRTLGGYPTKPYGEYPIAANTAISEGAVVKLSDGKVVLAGEAEEGAILGIAAETHSGTVDDFNARSNGTVIAIYDDPNAVFETASDSGPTFTIGGVVNGKLDTSRQNFIKDTTAANNKNLPFVVVNVDTTLKKVYVKPVIHAFGVKMS